MKWDTCNFETSLYEVEAATEEEACEKWKAYLLEYIFQSKATDLFVCWELETKKPSK